MTNSLTVDHSLFKTWKIRDNICYFPASFTKDHILDIVNTKFIFICEICGKIDINYKHYNNHYFKT